MARPSVDDVTRWRIPAVVAALVAGAAACAPAGGEEAGGVRTVALTIHHSRFEPSTLTVDEGTTVRFVVRNTDPIDHELIVGDDAVHARHENGTEAHHGAKPGEVSVAAGETATTTYRFDEAGDVLFACHLPRHLAYGMVGTVRVV